MNTKRHEWKGWTGNTVVALIALVWIGLSWMMTKPQYDSTNWDAYILHMERTMWAFEVAEKSGENVADWISNTFTPQGMVLSLKKRAQVVVKHQNTDAVKVQLALVIHRLALAQTSQMARDETLSDARELLREVPRWEEEYYDSEVRTLLSGEAFTKEQREKLVKWTEEWPKTWALHYLRSQAEPGYDILANGGGYAKTALRDLQTGNSMMTFLALSGLVGVWFALRLARSQPPKIHHRVTALHRLWHPVAVMSTFVACYLFAQYSGGVFVSFGGFTRPGFVGDSMARWWFMECLNQIFHAVLLAFPVYVLLSAFVRRRRRYATALGFEWRELRSLQSWVKALCLAGLLIVLAQGLILLLEALAIPGDDLDWISRSSYGWGDMALPMGLFWGALMAPLVEEIVFRGFLFRSFSNTMGTRWAVFVSSLLFALYHFYSVPGCLSVFVMGVSFCLIYHRSGSLALAMMTHACINAFWSLAEFTWLR